MSRSHLHTASRRPRGLLRHLGALALLAGLSGCGAPVTADRPGRDVAAVETDRAGGSASRGPVFRRDDAPPHGEPAPADAPLWVANHAVATLWDGPAADASPVGRLPVGSYFRVTGDGVEDRIPVSYPGNASIPEVEAWIEARAIGPTSEPGPDWREPNWPPRRLVLGQRGEVVRGDPDLPLVALTFDAGAGSGAVHELLDVLKDRNVRATFFVAGAFADRYPAIVARIAAEGHELANHSYSHPDFRRLSEAEMRNELRLGTASIEAAAGVRIAPLWRPPFGGRDDRVLRVVQDEGFRSIYWTFDSGDWLADATTERVRSAVLRQASAGAVVVHHVSPAATARAMPDIIDELRRRGYELTTVSEIIGP